MSAFAIRAELPGNKHIDFIVNDLDLFAARQIAEDAIEGHVSTGQKPDFEWHGLVVFVDTIPAERSTSMSKHYSLASLLNPLSIRKDLRGSAHTIFH